MFFDQSDIMVLLDAFGEPVIISSSLTQREITAVVDFNPAPPSGIDLGQDSAPCQLTAATSDANGVTADWSALVRGVSRPVLQALDDGSGVLIILLGDPQ